MLNRSDTSKSTENGLVIAGGVYGGMGEGARKEQTSSFKINAVNM